MGIHLNTFEFNWARPCAAYIMHATLQHAIYPVLKLTEHIYPWYLSD
jgi:hypothetical protein